MRGDPISNLSRKIGQQAFCCQKLPLELTDIDSPLTVAGWVVSWYSSPSFKKLEDCRPWYCMNFEPYPWPTRLRTNDSEIKGTSTEPGSDELCFLR